MNLAMSRVQKRSIWWRSVNFVKLALVFELLWFRRGFEVGRVFAHGAGWAKSLKDDVSGIVIIGNGVMDSGNNVRNETRSLVKDTKKDKDIAVMPLRAIDAGN
ncbi:hypothetical protein CCM_04399 [Cordyceps militaris CM01]|uniref:Uncharacterized protein n=1 Tax=Cordyceps militaris (strain CM01) TaxID=983644 RepID=G3JER8_CORMM|nr:uncharacterized protein CCM_04399 [Cordyceps militaris CM01]EGX93027.1 hypothetical protein CCM_04399 [Cordyceps militaris CM01]